MKRSKALELIKLAIADGDQKAAVRLFVENRNVGRQAFNKACKDGEQLRQQLGGRKASDTTFAQLGDGSHGN